ncbi:MAG: phosphoribosylaminoimidazolesuccinocarboxamide synthase [candidate division WOR-3 bacterium]
MLVGSTDLTGLKLRVRGKVRDVYELGDSLLIVSTDRLSAFDVVLPDLVPDKGRALTQLSKFWFRELADLVPNHMLSCEVEEFPAETKPYHELLRGRTMLVRKATPLPIECIVRGYLAGSGWKEYQSRGTVCGIRLPDGLRQADRLPEPIFTPSTKAESGHDVNITREQARSLVGSSVADRVAEASLAIYRRAADYALKKGIIIADTKFEFGLSDGEPIWIDEALTPDSSRFWSVAEYQPGSSPPSFDKQFVRDYLESLGWDKKPPAPHLPADVVAGTSARYREAFRSLTGRDLE